MCIRDSGLAGLEVDEGCWITAAEGGCLLYTSGERHRWVGERRGSREPVSCGDVCADGEWNGIGAGPGTAPDDRDQPECCHKFTEHLSLSLIHI